MNEDDDNIYDEVEIEDMDFDPDLRLFSAPCPCGDRFLITLDALQTGAPPIAECPSCSLRIRVLFDTDDLLPFHEQAAALVQPAAAC